MKIRKLFKFEGAHIVRNCSSEHCKYNIHGHSYQVEVFLSSNKLDKGYMVVDFILLDKIKEFIVGFDHSYSLWDKEEKEFKDFIYKYNKRVAEIPVSPSAEGYALMFFYATEKILENTRFKNGEGEIKLSAVRVHETATGYAEVSEEDRHMMDFTLDDIRFSPGIQEEWKDLGWWQNLKDDKPFENPEVELNLPY
ncbi:MAG: 6-carboxytetrahydropterin synthase [Bacteroidales bacterium]|nr:6-carboxytetrahydropterin synthase [Bacteroidales bacterium]MCF8457293.1 6-carboxytetrahydropterin synthase [Bacteroidales bacterium]